MSDEATEPTIWVPGQHRTIYASYWNLTQDPTAMAPVTGQLAYVDSGDVEEGQYIYDGTQWRRDVLPTVNPLDEEPGSTPGATAAEDTPRIEGGAPVRRE